MKRTQLKDALRNIWKQRVSYISIVFISMLAVTAFLGIAFSVYSIRVSANTWYRERQTRDIEVLSTLLMGQSDLDAIRETEGVEDAEAVWETGAVLLAGEKKENVSVQSVTERINLPELLSGRMPESEDECLVEDHLLQVLALQLGDRITLQDALGGKPDELLFDSFLITGSVNHPDHTTYQMSPTLYVLVPAGAFDRDGLDGHFMKVELRIAGAPEDRYSDDYWNAVGPVKDLLNDLALERAPLRDEEIHDLYQTRVDKKQQELDDAKADLDAARKELDDGWTALAEGEQELKDTRAQLDEAKVRLEEGWKQLEWTIYQLVQGKKELDAAKPELDAAAAKLSKAKTKLDSAKAELESGWNSLEDAKSQIRAGLRGAIEASLGPPAAQISWAGRQAAKVDSASATAMPFWVTTGFCYDLNQSLNVNVNAFIYSDQITDDMLLQAYVAMTGSELGFDAAAARASLSAAVTPAAAAFEAQYGQLQTSCRAWDESHAKYMPGLNDYNTSLAKYNKELASYKSGMSQYETGMAAYQRALAQYNDGKAQYEQGLLDAENAQKTLEENRKKLEDGEVRYEDGQKDYGTAAVRLEEARDQLNALTPCRWVILDSRANPGYLHIDAYLSDLFHISTSFSLLFVVIAALVIYATIGKMAEEQRSLIGASKAKGLFTWEIMMKYLLYGVSATLLGVVLGLAAACFGLERMMVKSYSAYYVFAPISARFQTGTALIVLLLGLAVSVLAVLSSCGALLRSRVIALMQPPTPKGAKGTGSGRMLSLYSRLILRNVRSDLRRVIVTIVSIAGCCSLLVIGFTIRNAVSSVPDRQYGEMIRYEQDLQFDSEQAEGAEAELGSKLTEKGAESLAAAARSVTYSDGNYVRAATLYATDLENLPAYYKLMDPRSEEEILPSGSGIYVTNRFSETTGLGAGDRVTLYDGSMNPYEAAIAGVFDYHVGQIMFCSKAYEAELFGRNAENNRFFVRLNGSDPDALREELSGIAGFRSLTGSDSSRQEYLDLTGVINLMILVLTVMAALLAYFILLNLVNTHIFQRKRELVIMRINGFTVRETKNYIVREAVFTTVFGILLGIGEGAVIGRHIVSLLEKTHVELVRSVNIAGWLISAALTALFAVAVYSFALRSIKRMKLSDL